MLNAFNTFSDKWMTKLVEKLTPLLHQPIQVALVKEVQPNDTSSSTPTTINTWVEAFFNTVEGDNILSLNTNTIAIQSGKYKLKASGYQTSNSASLHTLNMRIRNTSNNTTVATGMTYQVRDASSNLTPHYHEANAIITITEPTNFTMEYFSNYATNRGSRNDGSPNEENTYAQFEIIKIG